MCSSNGSSITRGAPASADISGENAICVYLPDVQKIAFIGNDSSSVPSQIQAVMIDSGAPLTWTTGAVRSAMTYASQGAVGSNHGLAAGAGNEFFFTSAALLTKARIETDNSITLQESVEVPNISAVNNWSLFYNDAMESVGVMWTENTSFQGSINFYTSGRSNVTADNFIGFSEGDYLDGETATVIGFGGKIDTQVGLTINGEYYVQEDGLLDVVANPIETVLAGRAISDIELIVKERGA